ncbi:MAG: DUF423 domain-containing protein [Pseudomonadota bacterium]|nr:DUF423 domain-containing protein [Pseudomonadota bacterium]
MAQPSSRAIVAAGALLGASAVSLGAFGAHALGGMLTAQQARWWQTAVQYQMWHALALLLVATLDLPHSRMIGAIFFSGTLIFSSTLFLMALGLPLWLGALTPIGGLMMIVGWLLLAWTALRPGDRSRH